MLPTADSSATAGATPSGAVAVRDVSQAASAWRVWLLVGATGLVAWLALASWMPSDDPTWTTCLFRRVTQHDCPSCGVTRSLSLLAHGDLRGSLERHPLAAPLAAEFALLWLLAPLALRRGWRPPERWVAWWAAANLAALLVAWGVRLAR